MGTFVGCTPDVTERHGIFSAFSVLRLNDVGSRLFPRRFACGSDPAFSLSWLTQTHRQQRQLACSDLKLVMMRRIGLGGKCLHAGSVRLMCRSEYHARTSIGLT